MNDSLSPEDVRKNLDYKGPIVILGMHRSGTSLISGVLHLGGASAGDEKELLSANKTNEKGFFENGEVVAINDEILEMFGGSWDNPPDFPHEFENDPKLFRIKAKIKSFILKMNTHHPLWIIKDPRMCITFKLWNKFLPAHTLYVVTYRKPEEVIASLHAIWHKEEVSFIPLWVHSWKGILDAIAHKKVLYVSYQDFVNDPAPFLHKLCDYVNSSFFSYANNKGAIDSFISKNLRHQKTSRISAPEETITTRGILSVADILEDAALLSREMISVILKKDATIHQQAEQKAIQQKRFLEEANKTKVAFASQIAELQKGFFHQYKLIQSELISVVGKLNRQELLLQTKEQNEINLVKAHENELSLRNETITALHGEIFSRDIQMSLVRASKFWKLRDRYLRGKWAILNPFKFTKKYLWRRIPTYSQVKWATDNPMSFLKKHVFEKDKQYKGPKGSLPRRKEQGRRILWVVPPLCLSGGLRTIFEIANEQSKNNHVEVLSLSSAPDPRIDWMDIHFEITAIPEQEIKKIQQYASSRHFDVVFATGYQTALTVSLLGCKNKIYYIQDYEPNFYNADVLVAERSYDLLPNKIAINTWIREKILRYNKTNTLIVRNGTKIYPDVPLEKPDIIQVFAYYKTKISTQRGADILEKVILLLYAKGIRVKVIGHGDSPGEHCDFLGELKREELLGLYKTAHIFIDTSRHRGCSTIAMEASQFGVVPVLTNKNIGVAEYGFDETNSVFVSEDEYEIVEKVVALVGDIKRLKKMSENVKILSRSFDFGIVEKNINQAIGFFERKNTFPTPKIAIFLHLYYVDLWPEIQKQLLTIVFDVDLYVTIPADLDSALSQKIIDEIYHFSPSAHILQVENKGLDVGSFFDLFSLALSLEKTYDYFLKIHTKKSIGVDASIGNEHRNRAYANLMGSPSNVMSILEKLKNPLVGMIGGKGSLMSISLEDKKQNRNNNAKWFEYYRKQLGIRDSSLSFFGGTMFWAKWEPFYRKFKDAKITSSEFEAGYASDGLKAHAFERLFANIIRDESLNCIENSIEQNEQLLKDEQYRKQNPPLFLGMPPANQTFSNRAYWALRHPLKFVQKYTVGIQGEQEKNNEDYIKEALDKPFGEIESIVFKKSTTPRVSIIIPVYNKWQFTYQCLLSLQKHTKGIDFEVLVVDNASSDSTRELLERVQGVRYIRNDKNIGFAKACNKGASQAKGEYLVFLNNDTVPLPGWLAPLIRELITNRQAGIVGSKLIYPNGMIQHAGVLIDQHGNPYHQHRGILRGDDLAVNIKKIVPAVTGACLAMSKELFVEVKGFDSTYCNGFEDVDLCLRVRILGYVLMYCPKSCLYHYESITEGRQTHDGANTILFLDRWGKTDILKRSQHLYEYSYPMATPPRRYVHKFRYLGRSFFDALQKDGLGGAFLRAKNFLLYGKGRLSHIYEPQAETIKNDIEKLLLLPDKFTLQRDRKLKPLVSIIIPVHNQVSYTLQCLRSIAHNLPVVPFEVVIVDDLSTDATQSILSLRSDIVYFRNKTNVGFVGSCNKGAALARGEYLYFLNNDTLVMKDWLDSSVERMKSDPLIGLVGSKLIYPDGRLQEAGGIIWSDGSGCNYGWGNNPSSPEYNFVRDVDYCSGAAILVLKTMFNTLGGFDSRYAPAYYEDTDLSFSLRKAGFRTIYNPFSQVVHFEGITAGTDITKGVKSYQVRNQKLFTEKWRKELVGQGVSGVTPRHIDATRTAKKRILILDQVTPMPDKDSGSVDMFYLLKILSEFGHQLTFVPVAQGGFLGDYVHNLQKMGVECFWGDSSTLARNILRTRGREFDIVIISRISTASIYFAEIKAFCPQAKVIFNTVDLHYLRYERQAEHENDGFMRDKANKLKIEEMKIVRNADVTLVVSDTEKRTLCQMLPDAKIKVVPIIRVIPEYKKPVPGHANHAIVFIGGFQHRPNLDAVRWFCTDIFPLILKKVPDACFHIIGSNTTKEILRLSSKNIIVHGHVKDADFLIQNSAVTVAPLRYGAGQKGKIVHSLSLGVPCVSTTLGVEAMGIEAEEDILIGDTPEEFAKQVVRILDDPTLREALSRNGYNAVKENFDISLIEKQLAQILADLDK